MLLSILVLFKFPHLLSNSLNRTRGSNIQILHEIFFWLFIGNAF
jgi:hypothetical protein